jgi:nucleoid DNA-binding protein
MSTGKSKAGRDELTSRVQRELELLTKKQAEKIINVVIAALEATLLNNLGTDKFTLKLNSFGKFSVRHKAGITRKIPLLKKPDGSFETRTTNDKRKVKFVTLGDLRKQEVVPKT